MTDGRALRAFVNGKPAEAADGSGYGKNLSSYGPEDCTHVRHVTSNSES